jgi:hypothetical protein
MHILFSTYRTFTNTRVLIDTLITRYKDVLPASLDMTEDIRQKSLKYENLSKRNFCFHFSYFISEIQTEYEYTYISIPFVYLTVLIFAYSFILRMRKLFVVAVI